MTDQDRPTGHTYVAVSHKLNLRALVEEKMPNLSSIRSHQFCLLYVPVLYVIDLFLP